MVIIVFFGKNFVTCKFLIGGGRNNKFPEFILDHVTGSMSDFDTFIRFLEWKSPLDYSVDGRLRFETKTKRENGNSSSSTSSSLSSSYWVVLLGAVLHELQHELL